MNFNYGSSAVGALLLAGVLLASLPALHAGDKDDFIIGATTHFGHGKGFLDENLKVFRDSGMVSPRDDIGWGTWQKVKGQVEGPEFYRSYLDRAVALGLDPLNIVGYQCKWHDNGGYPKSAEAVAAYAEFTATLVAQYKGKCRLYQVYNEWDGGCGMGEFKGQGDAKSYAKLIAAAYPRMKAADPAITVIANSVCTGEKFLEETLKEGVLKSCDGIAFHAYNYGQFGAKRLPEAFIERVAGVDKLLKRYNDGKEFPIYITEIGWPNHITRSGSTDAESGDYIARVYLCAKTLPAIKGLWWYDFQDDGLNPEYNEDNFGIVRTDLTPKEPFQVIRTIAHIIAKGKFVGKLETGDEKVIALKFRMPDGTDAIAAWNLYEDVDVQVAFKNAAANKPAMQVYCAGFAKETREWGARDWVVKRDTPFVPDEFLLTVRGRPWILEGELSQVSVARLVKRPFPRAKKAVVRIPVEALRIPSATSKSADRTYNFGDPKSYRSIDGETYGGKQDFDASVSLRWDAGNLYLKTEVTDSAFHQDHAGAETWMGDGIQVAFQDIDGKTLLSEDFSEFDIALAKGGPEAYGRYGSDKRQEGPCHAMTLDIKQEGAKTVYNVKVPAAALGMKEFKAGGLLGFSLLVNDDDGKGRKGYLHWGDGIGDSKDPDRYNLIKLEE